MKKLAAFLIFIVSLGLSLSGQAPFSAQYEDRGIIENNEIDEASGIAASKKNINVLWTHNDSGDLPRIFAMNSHGKDLGIYTIDNATNRDWEDIEVGPGPDADKDYLYIAEVGDNVAEYDIKYIYRIPEPTVNINQEPVNVSLGNAGIIKFRYPDGKRDAETLLLDPLTKDIYVVSKREENVNVYLAAYPQSLDSIFTLEKVATLPLTSIVAGDISPDGKEILLKNYDFVYYWKRNSNQTIAEALKNNQYSLLPYTKEPQGEGMCWSYNADGYYTISEELIDIPAHLYFYSRTDTTNGFGENDHGLNMYLEQNYPNPFNPETKIGYYISEFSLISLKVYNILGEEIAELLHEGKEPGNYQVLFKAANLTNGTYLYKLSAGDYIKVRAMTLLK